MITGRRSQSAEPVTFTIKGEPNVNRTITGIWHTPARKPEEVARLLANMAWQPDGAA